MGKKIVYIFNAGLDLLLKKSKSLSGYERRALMVLLAVMVVLTVFYIALLKAPAHFPEGEIITIEKDTHLDEIAVLLEQEKVVRSAFTLRILILLFIGERDVRAGDYYFDSKVSLLEVARLITRGEFGVIPVKITIPEGATVNEIALIFESNFEQFNGGKFLELALPKEGYLFPDTYFFLPTITEKKVVKVMEENFAARIEEINNDIEEFGEPLSHIVIMASLLEKEARTMETRRTIAGILWTRIAIGMPLQVDAVFLYINGKNTFELSLEDLKIDSPYNTYLYPGLPHGPIANPGLNALKAAIKPIETNYLFYLSDLDGVTHYSETFEGHKLNKQKYLR